MKLFLLIFFLLKSKFILADEFPNLFGCFCEGGLIVGKIDQKDKIIIDGSEMKPFKNGEFIFAFGRKYKDQTTIKFNDTIKTFKVEKKKYKIERISGLPKKKVEPNKDDLKRIIKDREKIKLSKKLGEKKKLFGSKFILPVKGRLSGVFGSQRILNSKPRSPHYGIDIAQKEGTPIVAPSSGKVKLVDYGMFFTGNTVVVDHGLGLISIFAHLQDIFVTEGQYLKIGEKIGSVGMTGRATGPHLHWGIYLEKKPVDPLSLTESDFY